MSDIEKTAASIWANSMTLKRERRSMSRYSTRAGT